MEEPDISVSSPVRHGSKMLLQRIANGAARAGLVIGCGAGEEVVYVNQAFPGARVIGFDVAPRFSSRARGAASLLLADVKLLPFAAESFDFALAIHSIEHVGDPREALAEVRRVLRPGAWFYLGVPNRTRLLGYLGSPNAATWQKIYWNAIDYGNRIRGRFKNELGAHAGFDREELERLLETSFADVEVLTEKYLHFKYDGRIPRPVLRFLLSRQLSKYSVSSHYAICRKG